MVGVGTGAQEVAEHARARRCSEAEDGDAGPRRARIADTPLFPTDPDRVFWALQGRRLPAKRHPYGIQLRIDELEDDHIIDEGGDLWHRRIEELDALACALCAHRFAVGHASLVDGVVCRARACRTSSRPRRDAAGRAASACPDRLAQAGVEVARL